MKYFPFGRIKSLDKYPIKPMRMQAIKYNTTQRASVHQEKPAKQFRKNEGSKAPTLCLSIFFQTNGLK